jgi:hypothetical protein
MAGNDVIIDVVVNADVALAKIGEISQASGQIPVKDVVINTDQATAPLENLSTVQEKVAKTTEMSAAQYRRAGVSLGYFAMAMTNVLMLTNALPDSMGKSVRTTLLLATTTINAVYAIVQLKKAYDILSKSVQVQIVLQSILNALTGWGLAKVALAVGVGAAAYVGTSALMNKTSGGGAVEATPASSRSVTNNFYGPVLGTETELARKLTEIQRQDARLMR